MTACVGPIELKRRYWQCRCGADGSYAVDDLLRLDGHFTRTLQKHICRLTADCSFAASSEHIKELLHVGVCPETVRGLSERHGKAMFEFQSKDEMTPEAFKKASGEVEFTTDAGKVNTREEGWKDLKIGVIQKRESGESMLPADWDKQRLPMPTIHLAFAEIAKSKRFRRNWSKTVRRLGVMQFGEVHVLADGASWIWKSVNRVLSGCVQTLDIYHGCEYLSKGAAAIFGEHTEEAKTSFEKGRSLLLSKGWVGVCEWVGECLAVEEPKEQERRRTITEKVIVYFSKHVGRLNYAERLAEGRAIGSGVVEGKAKTLGLRLKARGARWNLGNVRPMASLVCVRHSVQWNAYWVSLIA